MRSSWAVALVAAIALAGCGEETGEDDVAGDPAGQSPSGTYVVTDVTRAGQPHELVPGSQVRITFSDDTLGIHGGCNHLSGTYTLDGDRLTVGPVGGTDMGCEKALMDQDTWLAGLFAEPVTVAEDPFTLTAGDVVLTLAEREAVSPDAPLTGTTWTLDGFVDGEMAGSVPAGATAHLQITDGRVSLMAGCNSGTGPVTVADATIEWGPIALTRKACPGAAGEVERRVLAVLEGATTYTIEEHSLTVTKGEHALTFRTG